MKVDCKNCLYMKLLKELKPMAEIVIHHGDYIKDSCKFRETFIELAKDILRKCEEVGV